MKEMKSFFVGLFMDRRKEKTKPHEVTFAFQENHLLAVRT